MSPKAKYTNTLYRTPTCTSNSEEPKVINSHVEQNKKKKPEYLQKDQSQQEKNPQVIWGGMLCYNLKITFGEQQIAAFFQTPKYTFP